MIDRKETYRKAIKKYGLFNQLTVAVEELSELAKEVCKAERGMFDRGHMTEEIADVEIILEQLKMIFDIKHYEIEGMKFQKIERLNERIEGNK